MRVTNNFIVFLGLVSLVLNLHLIFSSSYRNVKCLTFASYPLRDVTSKGFLWEKLDNQVC